MIKINSYSVKGVKSESFSFPKTLEAPINKILLAQALRVYGDKSHHGLSKTKTRGEVSASGAKIWRQKGTGRARHGARSAPIFVGGGIAHGPKGVKRQLTLPKKMRKKALNIALTLKAKNGKVIVVSKFSSLEKTKEAKVMLDKIAKKEGFSQASPITIVLDTASRSAKMAFRNLNDVSTVFFKDLNAQKVFHSQVLLLDRGIFDKEKKSERSKKVGTVGESENRGTKTKN